MTLSSTTQRADYIGAGTVGPFAYNFRIFAASDLVVESIAAITSVVTPLVYPADYTVSGVGNRSGGSITLTNALAVGDALVIRRVRPLTQTTNFRNQQRFTPDRHEDAFDNLMMIAQQQQDELGRTIRLDPIYDPADYDMVVPPLEDGEVWVGNTLNGIDNRRLDGSGIIALPGDGRTTLTATGYLDHNKVFCPLDYGAVGDGVTNDGPAIRACLVAARAWATSVPIVTGFNDTKFRVPVVDLRGRCYATNVQIEVPSSQGMTIQNGTIQAGAGFAGGLYLVHTGALTEVALLDSFRNNNLVFRNIIFDNKHVGGGLLLERFNRLSVDACIFAHYQTEGLRTTNTGSHEMLLTNSRFGEYWWAETDSTGYLAADLFVGTGLSIDSNDNHINNCVIQLSKIGIKVNRAANLFNQIHIWTGYVKDGATVAGPTAALLYLSTGLWITANATGCLFNQMYMDGCEVLWENPWKTQFTNSYFLNGWGDAARGMIRFKPSAAGQFVDGVIITGNRFDVSNGGLMLMTKIDTSTGTFNGGQITKTEIHGNSFTGVTPVYTRVKQFLSGTAVSSWAFDLTGLLAFGGAIQQVIWSVYHWGGGTQLFRMVTLVGNVITFQSFAVATPGTLSANNATVYIDVSCNKSN